MTNSARILPKTFIDSPLLRTYRMHEIVRNQTLILVNQERQFDSNDQPRSAFSAQMRPSCETIERWAIASPRPTPPVDLFLESSTRKNGSKILLSESVGTPGP